MNGKTLAKIGIVVLVVGAIGFVVFKNVNKDKAPETPTITEEKYEDTYIDDGYGDVEDVDLNEEFEDRVETDKEVSKDESTDKEDDATEKEEDLNKDDEEKEDSAETEDKEESTKPAQSQSAVFQGFADDSFVEMKIGDEYRTYRVSPGVKPSLSNKNIGDNVSFKFVEENGQLTIVEVN